MRTEEARDCAHEFFINEDKQMECKHCCLLKSTCDMLSGKKNEEEEDGITCPLCGEFIKHEQVGPASWQPTHVWICTECNFVSLEFNDARDIYSLRERLGL